MARGIKSSLSASSVSGEEIEHAILLIRGQKVMLDRGLARLYGVETKALKRAVQRNAGRFPADFMFQLTPEEYNSLRYQFGTLKRELTGILCDIQTCLKTRGTSQTS